MSSPFALYTKTKFLETNIETIQKELASMQLRIREVLNELARNTVEQETQ